MSKYIAIIVTMLTGIGGHFINRRWDRALLFVTLTVIWGLTVGVVLFAIPLMLTEGRVYVDNNSKVIFLGFAVLWLASIIVTIYDAFNENEKLLHRWTISGAVGSVGITVLASLFLYYCVSLASLPYLFDRDVYTGSAYSKNTTDMPKYFTNYIYFGHTDEIDNLPLPPEGDAYLSGRFIYKNTPASDVTLTAILNNQYETETVTTDENGVFHIRVPAGTWYINLIKTETWKHMPIAFPNYTVITGDEPRMGNDNSYPSYAKRNDRGKRIVASEQGVNDPFTLTILENVVLNWPNDSGDGISIDNAVASWEPLDGADQYLVKISRVETRNRGWSSHVVNTQHVQGSTQLAMNQFKTLPTDETDLEYSIAVYAFDAAGKYLSESIRFGDKHRFRLQEQVKFVDESIIASSDVSPDMSDRDLTEIYENKQRINAIATLIEEGLLDEAGSLITKVKGKTQLGRFEAVQGYLAAKRGECTKANQLFATAKLLGGDTCIPKSYRGACSLE